MTQLEFLRYLLNVLESVPIPYAIVGSFASGIWGEPRMTQDIDVVIQLGRGHVDSIIAHFPAPEFYVSRTAIDEAVCFQSQFNVIHPTSGNKIDFMIAGRDAWSISLIARCRRVALLPECEASVAAPEDVILGKLIYYREGGSDKHLRDIAGILRRSGEIIDRDYLEQLAGQLNVADIWRRIDSQP